MDGLVDVVGVGVAAASGVNVIWDVASVIVGDVLLIEEGTDVVGTGGNIEGVNVVVEVDVIDGLVVTIVVHVEPFGVLVVVIASDGDSIGTVVVTALGDVDFIEDTTVVVTVGTGVVVWVIVVTIGTGVDVAGGVAVTVGVEIKVIEGVVVDGSNFGSTYFRFSK